MAVEPQGWFYAEDSGLKSNELTVKEIGEEEFHQAAGLFIKNSEEEGRIKESDKKQNPILGIADKFNN